jgi:hypothetical protein
MNITLKNVEYSARLSEETTCFSASIYVDGILSGTAANRGTGGATDIHPLELEERINEYCKTLPPVPYGAGMDGTFVPNADYLFTEMVRDHLLLKDMQRKLKRRLVFTRAGNPQIFQSRTLAPAEFARVVFERDRCAEMLGAEKVLNFLPEAEAFEIYKGAVA